MIIYLESQAKGYNDEKANGCLGEQKLANATRSTLELYFDGKENLKC